jgi:hypothetical protein
MLTAWKAATWVVILQAVFYAAVRGYHADPWTSLFAASAILFLYGFISRYWTGNPLTEDAAFVAALAGFALAAGTNEFLARTPAASIGVAVIIGVIAVSYLYQGSRKAVMGSVYESQSACAIALLPFGIGTVFGGLLYLIRRRTA